MNCKEQTIDNRESTRKVYYAPAASTRGENVIIYRNSLLRLCEQYHREVCDARSELAAAKIRIRWATLLIDQLPHYSGDRHELYTFACNMGRYAAQVIIHAHAGECYRYCKGDPRRRRHFRSQIYPETLLEQIRSFVQRTGVTL